MGKIASMLGMLFLVPFVFPVVAVVYSVGLRTPLWRNLCFLGPSLFVTLSSIACFAGVVSVIKRDNEHGIATAAGGIHLLVALIVFVLWWFIAEKQSAMRQSKFFALHLPMVSFGLGLFCTLFTLLSPYSFLNKFYGEPIFDFPVRREGLVQQWPGEWKSLTEAQKTELKRFAKAFAPWCQYEDKCWSALEKYFEVTCKTKEDKHQMRLEGKSPAKLAYVAMIREENKEVGLYGPHTELEKGLDEQQRQKVDEAIKKQKEYWFMAPLGTAVQVLDCSKGLNGFYEKDQQKLLRLFNEKAVVVKRLGLSGLEDLHLVLVIELQSAKIEDVIIVPCPGREIGRLITRKELSLIDEALQKHGNLGEHHDYSKGLHWLQENMHIGLSETSEKYFFNLSKRGEFGHIISFKMDKNSGQIEDIEKSSI